MIYVSVHCSAQMTQQIERDPRYFEVVAVHPGILKSVHFIHVQELPWRVLPEICVP